MTLWQHLTHKQHQTKVTKDPRLLAGLPVYHFVSAESILAGRHLSDGAFRQLECKRHVTKVAVPPPGQHMHMMKVAFDNLRNLLGMQKGPKEGKKTQKKKKVVREVLNI